MPDQAEEFMTELLADAWVLFENTASDDIKRQLKAHSGLRAVIESGMYLGIAVSFERATKDRTRLEAVKALGIRAVRIGKEIAVAHEDDAWLAELRDIEKDILGAALSVAPQPEPWEERVEYGHQTLEAGWIPEYRGIKYASHQRTVQFRLGPPLLLDHWSIPEDRKPFDPQPGPAPQPEPDACAYQFSDGAMCRCDLGRGHAGMHHCPCFNPAALPVESATEEQQ
jgi:hypothetical protein